jgi:hypothetical protein
LTMRLDRCASRRGIHTFAAARSELIWRALVFQVELSHMGLITD